MKIIAITENVTIMSEFLKTGLNDENFYKGRENVGTSESENEIKRGREWDRKKEIDRGKRR